MAAITTFEFYTNTYFGSLVVSADFDKWECKAHRKLDYLTQSKITSDLLADVVVGEKIKLAECEIIDILVNLDNAQKTIGVNDSGEGKQIKSKSAGNESISYDKGNDIYSNALGNETAQYKLFMSATKQYLFDTGLLYRGC